MVVGKKGALEGVFVGRFGDGWVGQGTLNLCGKRTKMGLVGLIACIGSL